MENGNKIRPNIIGPITGAVLFAALILLAFGLMGAGVLPGHEALVSFFAPLRSSPVALPVVILAFIVLAFAGVPQFVLITAVVLVFGPRTGFFLSWIATFISALCGFYAGRVLGAAAMMRFGGTIVRRLAGFVGRNGFWSALIVRLVPSGPFALVNMGLGVTPAKGWAFAGGTAVGILPKIGLIALMGTGMGAFDGSGQSSFMRFGVLFLAVAGWIGLAVWGARRLARRSSSEKTTVNHRHKP